jgi:hypothetical protein
MRYCGRAIDTRAAWSLGPTVSVPSAAQKPRSRRPTTECPGALKLTKTMPQLMDQIYEIVEESS